jgi:DNA-binding MarR family transcriptional regulator
VTDPRGGAEPGEGTEPGEALLLLVGQAYRSYVTAVRAALSEAGFDDVPRSGLRVIGTIAVNRSYVRDVALELGISRQAASQLVDALVVRGYCERAIDPDDRRHMVVSLTERGWAAARELRSVSESVDKEVTEALGPRAVANTRKALGLLGALGPHRTSQVDSGETSK